MKPAGAKTFRSPRAFTLIEIMVVVGIMGVILAAGIPSFYRLFHKEGFRRTLSDVIETCSKARARAILQETTTEVVFRPRERRCGSAQFAEGVAIDLLDINLREYRDADVARVRFFPNGTSDEMIIILSSARNGQCGITLEITTGLASVLSEADLQRLRR